MHLPPRVGDQLRIGVAVEVPEPYATLVQAQRARSGDPLARAVAPHVTILPPAVVEPEDMPAVHAHLAAAAAAHRPFVMTLQGAGTFRPVSPVVFVRVQDGAERCAELERDVRSGPLASALRFAYYPHVTVAHGVPEAAMDEAERAMAAFRATFAISWLSLFHHHEDGVWRRARTFPLGR